MAYIEIVSQEDAEGKLEAVYSDIVKKRGQLSEVLMIQSLNPESIEKHVDLYMNVMFGKSPLRRVQREMIAVLVSLTNNCPYCIVHHGAALQHFWKDETRLSRFKKAYQSADLTEVDQLLCKYAVALTAVPDQVDGSHAENMRKAGLTDRAILDAALVVAYFNFVNRLVLGLGVNIEAAQGEGFHYD
ncbi:MAG TPA: peroxidase [Bacteroidetes bacterium]|nr:peroxidase [Bacteroidota bacterium]